MLCKPAIFLFLLLNVVQTRVNNETSCARTKRRLPDAVIKNIIINNELETKKYNKKGRVSSESNLYESVLRDINDIASLKSEDTDDAKNQLSPDWTEPYERNYESDPLTTKFYTFSKMTSDESKPFSWINYLAPPIIQSLVKPNVLRSNLVPTLNRKLPSDYLYSNNEHTNSQKIIDDANLNNILELIAALRNHNYVMDNDLNMEVGFSNHASVKNGFEENNLSPAFLVENKSNYFKTDQGPFNRILSDLGKVDIQGKLNSAPRNYLSGTVKMEETENLNMPLSGRGISKEQIQHPSSYGVKSFGQHNDIQWPDARNNLLSIYNFSKTGPAMDRANMPFINRYANIDFLGSSRNNFFDVLGGIILDYPEHNASYVKNFTQHSDQNRMGNNSNYLPNSEDLQYALCNLLVERNNSVHSMVSNINPILATQYKERLEKLNLLDKLIGITKELNPNHLIMNFVSHQASVLPTNQTELDSKNAENKYFENKIDIKAIINKPTQASIREPQLPTVDIEPGSKQITLPEYEKMDKLLPYSTIYLKDEFRYESNTNTPLTTPICLVKKTEDTEVQQTDTSSNSVHQKMIPDIDFLGHMLNNLTRKSGLNTDSAEEFGGYVIVPLPENNLLNEWKNCLKNRKLSKVPNYNNLSVPSNFSVAKMMSFSNRNLLENLILNKLFNNFRVSLVPKRRKRRSKSMLRDVEDNHSTGSTLTEVEYNHSTDFSSTPINSFKSSQLLPKDKWIMNYSTRPHHGNGTSEK